MSSRIKGVPAGCVTLTSLRDKLLVNCHIVSGNKENEAKFLKSAVFKSDKT